MMRSVIAALPLLALAACGGASGPESVGSIAPPAGGATGGTGGSGGGVSTGGGTSAPAPTPTPSNFLDVASETTFNALGAFQTLQVTETGNFGQTGPILYQGNAATVRAPSGTVTYSPRDGIFTIQFTDAKAGIATGSSRFQDPGMRTQTAGWGVPNLTGFNYLDVLGPSASPPSGTDLGRADNITFFYQRPGTQTSYVSLAGYVRNAYNRTADPLVFTAATQSQFDRGVMVFGQETVRSQIPVSGTAVYEGGMLASMVVNTNTTGSQPNYFQWITGSSRVTLDFGQSTMALLLTGTTTAANYGGQSLPSNATGVPGDTSFRAEANGTISLASTGGFTGRFTTVTFGTINPNFASVNPNTNVAGANSVDGTFFGPNAVNVGGNFRIIGGVPDQRVDILGAFTGAKK